MFPVLGTERLRLREIGLNDAENLFAYFSKDETTRYYGQDSFREIGQAEALIRIFSKSYEGKGGIRWGIACGKTDILIGTIGYHLWSPRHKRAEIGFELHPDCWGKGYASEALAAVTAYGFDVMGLTRIGAVVFMENDASNKLVMKQGFEKEGILRNYMYQNDVAHDAYMYALVKR